MLDIFLPSAERALAREKKRRTKAIKAEEKALVQEELRRSEAIRAAADLLPNQSGIRQLGGEIGLRTRLAKLAALAPESDQKTMYGWYVQKTAAGIPLDISVFHGGTVTVTGHDGATQRVFISYTLGDEKPEVQTEPLRVATDAVVHPYVNAINTNRPFGLMLLPIFQSRGQTGRRQ